MSQRKRDVSRADNTGACSKLTQDKRGQVMWWGIDVHLALEVLHNIQKDIVNIGAVMELDFDGVEVAKRICDIELTIDSAINTLLRRLGSWLDVILPFC